MAVISKDFILRKFNPSVSLDITIRTTRELNVRMFVAKGLLRLAAWVLGMSSDIRVESFDA